MSKLCTPYCYNLKYISKAISSAFQMFHFLGFEPVKFASWMSRRFRLLKLKAATIKKSDLLITSQHRFRHLCLSV